MEQIDKRFDGDEYRFLHLDFGPKVPHIHVLMKGDQFIKTGCVEEIDGSELVFGYSSIDGPKSGKHHIDIFTTNQELIVKNILSEIISDKEFPGGCKYQKATIGTCRIRLLNLTDEQRLNLSRLQVSIKTETRALSLDASNVLGSAVQPIKAG